MKAQKEYTEHRTGILTQPLSNLAFLPLSSILSESELSALISSTATTAKIDPLPCLSLPTSPTDNSTAHIELMFTNSKATPGAPAPGTSYLSIWTVLLHPLSRGSIHITTSDPLQQPRIDPNYYAEPLDRTVMAAGLKLGAEIADSSPMSGLIKARSEPAEGALTDADWDAHIQRTSLTLWHPVGTASMGKVVDSALRVYGGMSQSLVNE